MKKLKINTCLEPMDEWTYESYVSDSIFENVWILFLRMYVLKKT